MGKIIVIEGACDGIGKTTQYKLLNEYLKNNGYDIVNYHFPSHGEYQGKGVDEYLAGHYGNIKDLSPYFINSLYAIDRFISWYGNLKKEYDAGKTIVLDRYTTSSLFYQSALIEDIEERKKFIDWVEDYEYNKNGIAKPDIVIFLKAPFELVTEMIKARGNDDGTHNDIHERDFTFMKKVYDNALFVADYLNWQIIECSSNNKMKSIEQIHQEIIEVLK